MDRVFDAPITEEEDDDETTEEAGASTTASKGGKKQKRSQKKPKQKEDEKGYRDRIYFRLKPDRTVKVYSSSSRPLLEWRKKRSAEEKKKRLFETGTEVQESLKDKLASNKIDASFYDVDGSWFFQDAAPLVGGKVQIETKELLSDKIGDAKGHKNNLKKSNKFASFVKRRLLGGHGDDEDGGNAKEKIRHDVFCEWGTLDGYSAKFRKGKIIKYKVTESGVPLGQYAVGTFSISISTHRPLVAKDFVAFQ